MCWWDSGHSLNSHRCNSRLGEISISAVFAVPLVPLFLQFRWPTQPVLSLPTAHFFFSLFPPFLSIKDIYPVGFPPPWHEVLLAAASINDWYHSNAENALCSDTCSFYYEGMNSLVRSFGVGICLKRWLLSATIISWREFFHAERYAVVSTQQYSIFLANHHRFCLLHIFGSCRVITPNTCLEGVDQLD